MLARRAFERTAAMGFAILAMLLVFGMAFSIRRLASEADAQVGATRAEEAQITRVERLRWNAELMISSGWGYLLSGEPTLLAHIQESRQQFDETMDALRRHELDSTNRGLVDEAERTARSFTRVQQALID